MDELPTDADAIFRGSLDFRRFIRRAWVVTAAASWGGMALILRHGGPWLFGWHTSSLPWIVVAALMTIPILLVGGAGFYFTRVPRRFVLEHGRLAILRSGRRFEVPRRKIRAVLPRQDGAVVVQLASGLDVILATASEQRARQLAMALTPCPMKLDLGEALVPSFAAGGMAMAIWIEEAAFLIAQIASGDVAYFYLNKQCVVVAVLLLGTSLPSFFVSSLIFRRSVTLGIDAIVVRKGTRRVLVPHADITDFELAERRLVLRRRGATSVTVSLPSDGTHAAIAMHLAGLTVESAPAIAPRRMQIRGSLERQGTFREAPVRQEAVFALLEAPDTACADRLDAARASAHLREGRARIRALASETIDPEQQRALLMIAAEADAAADGEPVSMRRGCPTRASSQDVLPVHDLAARR